jgi:DNA-binding NarL/FixJ family response regulator
VVLACLAAAVYVPLFGAVDALLEANAPTSQQMLTRIVLLSVGVGGALALLVRGVQWEQRAAAEADRRISAARLEGALLTLHELGIKAAAPAAPDDTGGSDLSAAALANRPDAALLTPREREVAVLIARGLTSKAIAETLVITERTATTHADRIRAKLGLRSRAEIVGWVLSGASRRQNLSLDGTGGRAP